MFARSFRLGVERLDDRNAPSSLAGNDVATTDWVSAAGDQSQTDFSLGGYTETINLPPGNKKPVITNFVVTVETGWTGRFTGKVVDENPGGLVVTLTGQQGCLAGGRAVTTDADGNFVFLGQLVHGADCGVVSADTVDVEGLPADGAEYDLTV